MFLFCFGGGCFCHFFFLQQVEQLSNIQEDKDTVEVRESGAETLIKKCAACNRNVREVSRVTSASVRYVIQNRSHSSSSALLLKLLLFSAKHITCSSIIPHGFNLCSRWPQLMTAASTSCVNIAGAWCKDGKNISF